MKKKLLSKLPKLGEMNRWYIMKVKGREDVYSFLRLIRKKIEQGVDEYFEEEKK